MGKEHEMAKNNRTVDRIQAVWNILGGEEGVDRLLAGIAEVVVKVLTAVALVLLPQVAGKKTSECFTNQKRWYYRDPNLDSWLPDDQSAHSGGLWKSLALVVPVTFKQMVETILGVSGDITELARLLIEQGHTVTLEQIEMLVERQEAGEDVGLRTDGYSTFFFVLNKGGSVSVVRVFRDLDDGRWRVDFYELSRGHRWITGSRICVRTRML